jgi:protein arginine kinase activator
MGCPECYHTFQDGLDSLLKAMHKDTKHIGKTPQRLLAETHTQSQISALREELAVAVHEERFEDAARLKVELEQILGK